MILKNMVTILVVGHTCSMTHTVEIEMPESTRNPDVPWRIAEYVRVLNASYVVETACKPSSSPYGDFAYVPYEVFTSDKPGARVTRIVRDTGGQYGKSVHCFVENDTGKVIKSAGWKAPAKDKDGFAYRYDLMDHDSRVELYQAGTRVSFYKK